MLPIDRSPYREAELEGRTALVTASSRGLGREIVLALAALGADCAVQYRSAPDAAEAVCDMIRAMGRKAILLQGDLIDEESNRRIVRETVAAFGRIDILVNNVGEFTHKPVLEHTGAEFERVIAGTVGSTFYCSSEALPVMHRNGFGRIINLGAAGAADARGREDIGVHLAGKAAVISLTRTLAIEAAGNGVTINAVSPGIIKDKELQRDQARGLTDPKNPVGRPGTAADVADAVLFLASPRADFINGAVIDVGGGWGL